MTTHSPKTALTTADQQRPSTRTRLVETAVRPRRRATSRRVLGWTATIATLGGATLLAVTPFEQEQPDAAAPTHGAGAATELDVRGIPTWWTDAAAPADGAVAATELDVRGVPTWWTDAAAPADGAVAATELDVRGIPTWWTDTGF
jgi:hypothetical protein